MRQTIILLLLGLTLSVPAVSGETPKHVSLAEETLTYDVIYKLGFINKVAGYATMSLRDDGDTYLASVYAQSAPWANNIYMLRDTLHSTMSKRGLYPIRYELIAHEDRKYKKDVLTFNHSGNTFTAEAVRHKRASENAPMTTSTMQLEAQGMTVDMLSSFFYLRTLDFAGMTKGQSVTVNIFSGSKTELLTISYIGKQKIEVNGEKLPVFYVNFTFTRKGKVSSDPISAWITADSHRIPVKVEGQLPVGKVRALYTGPNP